MSDPTPPETALATFDKLETDTKRKINPESLARLISIGKALERGDTAYLGKVRDGILQSAKVVLEHRRGSTPRPGYRTRAKSIKARK